MTKALEKALELASRLPDDAQDELAQAIVAELTADSRWQELLASSPQGLERLADEALEEERSRKTKPLDPRSL